jgi:Predicted periplasmic lipoprotein
MKRMMDMKYIKTLLPLVGLYLLTACGATSTTTHSANEAASFNVLNEWGDLYGQSYLPDFTAHTDTLHEALAEYCEQASADQLNDAQQAWLASHSSWQTLRVINVAPLTDGLPTYGDRIHGGNLFGGAGVTAVDALLNKALPVDSIGRGSVLVQGLPALEYILFEKIPMQGLNQHQCLWAQGIAENLFTMATQLQAQWLANVQDFKHPTEVAAGYIDRTQVLADVLNGVNERIEIVARYQLNYPVGIDHAVPELFALEGRFSGESFHVIANNIAGLKRLMSGGEYNLRTLLEDVGAGAHAHSLQTIVDRLEMQLLVIAAFDVDVLSIDTGSDNPVRSAYIQLHDDLISLSALLFDHVIDAVGGTALFNSVDGD